MMRTIWYPVGGESRIHIRIPSPNNRINVKPKIKTWICSQSYLLLASHHLTRCPRCHPHPDQGRNKPPAVEVPTAASWKEWCSPDRPPPTDHRRNRCHHLPPRHSRLHYPHRYRRRCPHHRYPYPPLPPPAFSLVRRGESSY